MEIRKLKMDDIDALIDNRVEFLALIRKIDNEKELRDSLKVYLEKHIYDGTIISYICIIDNKIVSSAILCIYERIPTAACITGKMGILLNVYTLKEYRKRGLARDVIQRVLDEAKSQGVVRVQLDYTNDSYELYRDLGFKCLNSEMAIILD